MLTSFHWSRLVFSSKSLISPSFFSISFFFFKLTDITFFFLNFTDLTFFLLLQFHWSIHIFCSISLISPYRSRNCDLASSVAGVFWSLCTNNFKMWHKYSHGNPPAKKSNFRMWHKYSFEWNTTPHGLEWVQFLPKHFKLRYFISFQQVVYILVDQWPAKCWLPL